ncbi:hypothetical protein NW754_011189 [Fusarium falciforme]|nr:hypothetical protein NW754_011189 [Fusarium falciforme]
MSAPKVSDQPVSGQYISEPPPAYSEGPTSQNNGQNNSQNNGQNNARKCALEGALVGCPKPVQFTCACGLGTVCCIPMVVAGVYQCCTEEM